MHEVCIIMVVGGLLPDYFAREVCVIMATWWERTGNDAKKGMAWPPEM